VVFVRLVQLFPFNVVNYAFWADAGPAWRVCGHVLCMHVTGSARACVVGIMPGREVASGRTAAIR
jgi:hypothetical protein